MVNPAKWLLCKLWLGHFFAQEGFVEKPAGQMNFRCSGCREWVGYLRVVREPTNMFSTPEAPEED